MKKFGLFSLLVAVLCGVLAGSGWAEIKYENGEYIFEYDSSVSAARNRVAEYAYTILNDKWYTSGTIYLWKGAGTETGWIRGIPYTLNTQKTFEDYKNLSEASKLSTSTNGMTYGMACAEFVTVCIRQGLPDAGLWIEGSTQFHKTSSSWKNYIATIDSNKIYGEFGGQSGYNTAW